MNPKKGNETTYWVNGLSCTNCAGKFEKNVKQLPGVSDASINFGAGKLTVVGHASIEEIEQAGAFDKLTVTQERETLPQPRGLPQIIKDNKRTILAALLIAVGYLLEATAGIDGSVLFLLAILIGGASLFKEGAANLLSGTFTMETLMTIAITGAILIGSEEEGAIVVILFAISEALEKHAVNNARRSIQTLVEYAPKKALIRRHDQELLLSVQDVRIGDVMMVKPGEKIAMDGIVSRGHSSVNQAAITGESLSVEKQIDDVVYAGTINEEGYLEVIVTKLVTDTTLSKMIHLVEDAQAKRAPAQAFVDKFAAYYTPVIMIIALLTAVIPPLVTGAAWEKWIYQGLSLLVVGCPCSLVISTPVAIVSAIGNGAKNGLLIKGGIFLEKSGAATIVAFDKTGTLTEGSPAVTDIVLFDERDDLEEQLTLAAALENQSQHPLASAIIKEAQAKKLSYQHLAVDQFQAITGKGITGSVAGQTYIVGTRSLFQDADVLTSLDEERLHDLQVQGKTVIFFGPADKPAGLMAVADQVRHNAAATVQKLKQLGITETVLLTGDNPDVANAIGNQLHISQVKSQLMPEDKIKEIQKLMQAGHNVIMVGDGVNDSPALASATVGVAMGGTGTDVALESADIVLMGDNLEKLPLLISLSRKTMAVIKQNIGFSLAIKLLAVLLVIPGWLTLWLAIAADMGATLLVTLNALRLVRAQRL
ncbi:heavy metal translocating P-type ATPase [Vagococcus acidifermentans]|uniref:Cd(2+)-exporting ATPase n=1 Tax=Vagococcus acidifermentans TaxID=564710 RepID=A0A430ATV5_9ENTE|nr:heavy metal translocating P-type ATPase [Vagococcus acidifermentans]RSU11492.1 heavy metal translocating P-type ATPase [Vagococcus acidifermentans]